MLNKKVKVLDSIGMPDQPHAVKMDQGYSNILLSVKSPLALIRWLPIKEEEEKGIGYYLYAAGSLKYDSVFGSVMFIVEPLKLAKKKFSATTKTKIVDVRYNFYISDNE